MEGRINARHIGIVACSYEGAALCYRTICNEGSNLMGEHNHPEVSLHTHALHEYMVCIHKDDWDGVADLMNSSARKLVSIGAEILVCPDNTIHRVFEKASKGISTTWLHISREVAKVAKENNFSRVGILGTKYLMESEVYPDSFSPFQLACIIPELNDRIEINRIIFEELVYGIIKDESKKYLINVIGFLKSKGCDAVVLGCTEIPLIIVQEDSPLPILDSTRILARAALRASTDVFPEFYPTPNPKKDGDQ